MSDIQIQEMISKANQLFSDGWEDEVDRLKQYRAHTISINALNDITKRLLISLRMYYVEHDSKHYKINALKNKEYAEELKNAVKDTLVVYDRFSVIRDEKQSEELMNEVLIKLFENNILVNDPLFLQNCYTNVFSTIPATDFAEAYSQLVYNIVAKLFGFESIKNMIVFNTGLKDKFVDTIYELIIQHHDSLKLNYLIKCIGSED